MTNSGPVFVGGCMRSGTTLLQRLLCALPDTNAVVNECQYLTSQLLLYRQWLPRYDEYLHEYFGSRENFELHTRSIVEGILLTTRVRMNPSKKLVLKHPQLSPHFPVLRGWLAEARFLVVVRDPRDTIASIMDVAKRHQESGLKSDLVQMGNDMERLSNYFKSYYVPVINQRQEMAGRLMFLRYEDLVKDTYALMKEVGKFCGLEIPEQALSEETLEQQDLGARANTQDDRYEGAFWSPLYSQGVSKAKVGRHKESLTDEQIDEIQKHCDDFNKAFRYW